MYKSKKKKKKESINERYIFDILMEKNCVFLICEH